MAQGCVSTGRRDKKRTVKIGEMRVEICRVRHAIIVNGRAHRLSDLSFRMLDLLVSRSPDPVSFADIERAVWNAQVTRETIKQRVTLLRENLQQIGIEGAAIEAVRNYGYRTTIQIRVVDPQSAWSVRRKAWLAPGSVLLLGAALFLGWPQRDTKSAAKPLLAVVTGTSTSAGDPAEVDALRRDMVLAISRFEGVQVIDRLAATGTAPAYLVRLSLQRSGQDRRLAAELVDGTKGTVLFAEQYDLASSQTDRAVLHFAHNIHAQLGAMAASGGRLSNEARARYAEAYRLLRLGDRQSLLGARNSLAVLASEPETNQIARPLLARVQADLVLRYAEPQSLARQAEQDIRALIVRQPGAGELRYSLARTLLAQGRRDEALDELRIAVRTMPFLSREILVIERGNKGARDETVR